MESSEIITWAAIGKIVFAGLVLYVIQPALLVLRDVLLWKAIHAYIINDELRTQIRNLLEVEEDVRTPIIQEQSVLADGTATYKINGLQVSKNDYDDSINAMKQSGAQFRAAQAFISMRRRRLDWILHHYKQSNQDNPIDALINAERESRARLTAALAAARGVF